MVYSRGGINQTSGAADCKAWQTGLVRLVLGGWTLFPSRLRRSRPLRRSVDAETLTSQLKRSGVVDRRNGRIDTLMPVDPSARDDRRNGRNWNSIYSLGSSWSAKCLSSTPSVSGTLLNDVPAVGDILETGRSQMTN